MEACETPEDLLELDFSQLPDTYTQTDDKKTDRILQLEKELEVMTRQLLQARNQVNTLHSEVNKYKRVHSQVSWLIDQFRSTISGATRDKGPQLEAIMPPPPPPLPALVSSQQGESLHVTTIDLVTPVSSEEALGLDDGEDEDEEEDYSDDWETLKGDEDSGTSSLESVPCAPSVPTAEEMTAASMLLHVTPQTHISELFRRLYPPPSSLPSSDNESSET